VEVTGQRARGPSPFAVSYPTKGNGLGNEEQDEVDPNGGGGGGELSDEQQQCMMPAGREQWNADAKAVAARQAFLARAAQLGENDLQNREFGALICRLTNGSVVLGPIHEGPPILDGNGNQIYYPETGGRPYVNINPDGCGSGVPIGYVHSHPGVNEGRPSDGDFATGQWYVDYRGADAATFGIYTMSQYQNQTGNYSTQVSRASLSDRSMAQTANYQPAWVNPDATPCPGST
jgi:hypothetical protein